MSRIFLAHDNFCLKEDYLLTTWNEETLKVAETDLLDRACLDNPLIDASEPTAHQRNPGPTGKPPDDALIERTPARRKQH